MAGPPAETPVVVLAAGRSSRLGEPKGLVMVEGRTWIDRQLEALGRRRAVLVLGHDRDCYLPVVLALGRPVDLVTNPDPDRGPFSSLQEGLAAVDPGSPAFVLPVDVPAPGKAVWAALEAALGPAEAAVPVHEGKGGTRCSWGPPSSPVCSPVPPPAVSTRSCAPSPWWPAFPSTTPASV